MNPVILARWTDLQQEIRHLALQRALRFVAASILAPFGAANVGSAAGRISTWAFAGALLLLALAEVSAIAESGLRQKERQRLEHEYPELAPHTKPGRWARLLGFVSGPPFSTALYCLLGGAIVVANAIR